MSKATTENDRNISTKMVAATFENELGSEVVSYERVWKQYGFFNTRKSGYSMEKVVNFPENLLFYLNQSYLTIKKNKKIYYCDFFIIGQIVQASNPPEDMSTYVLKENKVKMFRPKYNPDTGEFLGLYETVGFMGVRGSPAEVFFNYGYDKEKSKVLYAHYRRRIPNSFSSIIFNRHRVMIESSEADAEFSNIYFLLSSITNRNEEINKYSKNASISLIDVSQEQLNNWAGVEFNHSKLELFRSDKALMSAAVVKCHRHINDISNSNVVRNTNSLLSRREVEVPVDWIGESKKRVTPDQFKVAY